jgi:hypothetical protein
MIPRSIKYEVYLTLENYQFLKSIEQNKDVSFSKTINVLLEIKRNEKLKVE